MKHLLLPSTLLLATPLATAQLDTDALEASIPVQHLAQHSTRTSHPSFGPMVPGGVTIPAPQWRVDETDLPMAMSAQAVGDALYVTFNDYPVFEDENDANAKILLNGNFVVNPLGLDACSNLFGGDCDQLVSVRATTQAALAIELSATADAEFEADIEKITLPLPAITVGTFSVVPYVIIDFDVAGEAAAQAVASTVSHYAFTGGVNLDTSGIASDATPPVLEAQFENPGFTSGTGASLTIDTTLTIAFVILTPQGVPVGTPFLQGQAGLEVLFQPTANPWWDVNAPVTVNAGWFNESWQLLSPATLFDQTFDVADAGGPIDPLYESATARWSRTYEIDGQISNGRDVSLTSDGGLFVVGDGNGVQNHALIAKLDASGAVDWATSNEIALPGLRPQVGLEAANGDYVVAGNLITTGKPFVARFDSIGSLLWLEELLLAEQLGALTDLIELSDGRLAFCGDASQSGAVIPMAGLLASDGTFQWAQTVNVPGGDDGEFNALIELPNGNLALAGRTSFSDPDETLGFNAGIVSRFATDGSHVRTDLVGTEWVTEGLGDLTLAADGEGLVLCGWMDREDYVVWVGELDFNGDLGWHHTYFGQKQNEADVFGSNDWDRAVDIEPVDGGYVVLTNTGLGVDMDSQLFKVDESGALVFWKRYRGVDRDQLEQLAVTADNELVAIGTTKSILDEETEAPAGERMWIVRTSVDGQLNYFPEYGHETWSDEAVRGAAASVEALEPVVSVESLAITTSAETPTFVSPTVDVVLLTR